MSSHASPPPDEETVLAVLVLYNKDLDNVPCFPLLMSWSVQLEACTSCLKLSRVLVYDNSGSPRIPADAAKTYHYIHDPSNGGTKAAYLAASEVAATLNIKWLLLLDHDTALPSDFLSKTADELVSLPCTEHLSAIAPKVFESGTLISPSLMTSYGRTISYAKEGSHAARKAKTAISSATLIRATDFRRILPIPETFSLDYLDHWMFREIQKNGCLKISQARVEHSLSVRSMKDINEKRFDSILQAEHAFLVGNRSYSKFLHFLWNTLRGMKLLISVRRLSLVVISLKNSKHIIAYDD